MERSRDVSRIPLCNGLAELLVSELVALFLIIWFVFYFLAFFYRVPISSVGEWP